MIGSQDDFLVCKKLFQIFPSIENLCNKTDFFKIAQLSKQATISIGNDTGPMHIISRGNNPTFIFLQNIRTTNYVANKEGGYQ